MAKKISLNNLEQFLKRLGISGILSVPQVGVLSLFHTYLDKLAILDHAHVELLSHNLLREAKAREWILSNPLFDKVVIKKEPPSYVK
jgi:hypothetical protein